MGEDFIWFVKKAVQDRKSYSYSELYHSLLKIFIDAAASMPRAYGYAPADSDLYKTATMDPHPIIDQGSVDEYKKFIETAINKSDSTEAVELYWYMLEIF